MIKNIKKNHCLGETRKDGYAILELVFYIALFVVISLVVINAMITMGRSFRETSIQAGLAQAGNIMERISREIRASYDIDVASTSTDLKLKTTDGTGALKTEELLFSSPNVQLIENNVLTGNLNTPNIVVMALTFTQITTVKSKAVKIVLTIKSANDVSGRTENFYDTVVLRGVY